VVRYVALVHNHRVDGMTVDGMTRPQVLMNLGRIEAVDVDGLRRLAASIRTHFGDGCEESAGRGEVGLAAGGGPMEVSDARPIGGTWLLDGLWRELGVARGIEKAVVDRRFTTAVDETGHVRRDGPSSPENETPRDEFPVRAAAAGYGAAPRLRAEVRAAQCPSTATNGRAARASHTPG